MIYHNIQESPMSPLAVISGIRRQLQVIRQYTITGRFQETMQRTNECVNSWHKLLFIKKSKWRFTSNDYDASKSRDL